MMARLLCGVFGHRIFIRWFWMSHRRAGVECRAECARCGKSLSAPSAPPLQRKIRR